MPKPKIRCAVYTRKSSEAGLDQDFNSLDAQFEACQAYIKSQAGEGWCYTNRYDDGGLSGGTLERPALKQLLADIKDGQIDQIVLYKIDRLTRSLSDFARIVDRLEQAGASFVSVTQSFNTATSMGRLTLNILLSFAQFEREVTAERIRDKIAASKAKGMWMGGTVPFGYDRDQTAANTRILIPNLVEADHIKTIFTLYRDTPNLRQVTEQIARLGIRSKERISASGRKTGSSRLSKGHVHHLLTNPLYIGKIRHKDKLYDGQHQAIIDPKLWDDVQQKLQHASQRRRGARPHQKGARLKGRVFDETGDPLTPSHTRKGQKHFRYYVSHRLLKSQDPTGWRIAAQKLETQIRNQVQAYLSSTDLHTALIALCELEAFAAVAERLTAYQTPLELVQRVELNKDTAKIHLCPDALAAILPQIAHLAPEHLVFTCPHTLTRRSQGQTHQLGEHACEPNQRLLSSLAEAHQWLANLKAGHTLDQIATLHNKTKDHLRKHLKLALLSPKIQKAIVTGHHPTTWSLCLFIKTPNMPSDWGAQETLFGIV